MSIKPMNGYVLVKPYSRPTQEPEVRSSSLILHSPTSKPSLKPFLVLASHQTDSHFLAEGCLAYVDSTYSPKTTDNGAFFIHIDSVVCKEELTDNE